MADKDERDEKATRLAQALRDNLRKRKAQARESAAPHDATKDEPSR